MKLMLLQCFKHLYFNGNKLLYRLHGYLQLHIKFCLVHRKKLLSSLLLLFCAFIFRTLKLNLFLFLRFLLALCRLLDRIKVREGEAAPVLPAGADLEVGLGHVGLRGVPAGLVAVHAAHTVVGSPMVFQVRSDKQIVH